MRGSIAVAATAAALLAGFAQMTQARAAEAPSASSASCVPQAAWIEPSEGPVSGPRLLQRAAQASVVMLGERHDSAAWAAVLAEARARLEREEAC